MLGGFQLADVSMLGGTMPSVGLSGISSSEKRLSLCHFSPAWSVEAVIGVSSCLSLFLILSSLVGVYNIGISTVASCVGGACPWVCWSVEAGCSAISSCFSKLGSYSSCCTSFPLAVDVAWTAAWAGCWGTVEEEALSPRCRRAGKNTCPKYSRSTTFSSFLIAFCANSSSK